MARINIEDSWLLDQRRVELILRVGSAQLADGIAFQVWRTAQEAYRNGHLLQVEAFERIPGFSDFLSVGLAVVLPEGVYVKGQETFFSWLRDKQASASKGGKRSAAVRARKYGTSQPRSTLEAESKCPEPSYSSSYSKTKKESMSGGPDKPALETWSEDVYKRYPRRAGDNRKARAFKLLRKILEVERPLFTRAVENYRRRCELDGSEGTPYVKMFATFCGEDTWREWIEAPYDKALEAHSAIFEGGTCDA